MRRRFKKCLASIMAVLIMCSIYMVPAEAETTQWEWDNISMYGGTTDANGYFPISILPLPKGASVRWTVLEGGVSKYVSLDYGSKGFLMTDGVTNGNGIRIEVADYEHLNAEDCVVKIMAEVFDKKNVLKKTLKAEVILRIYVTGISITPPEDVNLKAMELGTYNFTAEQSPSNATSFIYYTLQNVDKTPVSESAAYVDENGNVTLKAAGTYTLKAEAKYSANESSGVSDTITFKCQPNPEKYFIEQKEGGAIPASIKTGDTLSLVLVREIEEPPVIKIVKMPPVEVEYIRQNGIINKGQAAKPIYAIKAKDLPTEKGIRISTGEEKAFETVIGNTEASGIQWSNDSGPYEYKVVESVDIKEIVENTKLEGSIQAVGEDQSGNNAQSGNDTQSGENSQSEDNDPSVGSAKQGNTSGSEGTVKSGKTGDSYYIVVGNSVTAGTGLNFVATRTGVAYEWTASNDCVTIGNDGVLKGIKPGTVEITGAYKDYDNDVEGSVSVELEVIKGEQVEEYKTPGNSMVIPSGDSTDEELDIEPVPKPKPEPEPEPEPQMNYKFNGPDKIVLAPGYVEKSYQFPIELSDYIREQNYGAMVMKKDEGFFDFKVVGGTMVMGWLNILPGLPNGTNTSLTIWATVKRNDNTDQYIEKKVIVQVSSVGTQSAGILGDDTITLEEGYAPAQYNYNLSGEPTPIVSLEAKSNTANAILKNGAVTIPKELTIGDYSFKLLAENNKGKAAKTVQVKVVPKKTAPQITGEDTINLEVGYKPVQYNYNATGKPTPTVSLLEDGNTANVTMTNGVVTIQQGLGVGSYSFTLLAENSVGTATKTVTVVVAPEKERPVISGEGTIYLDEGYSSVPYEYSVTGYPEPIMSILADGNTAKATLTNGNVTIPAGLKANKEYTFTLEAKNSMGTATKTVVVIVKSKGIKPQISGESAINLVEGYENEPYYFSVEGDPMPEMSLQDNTANAELIEGNVLIRSGLQTGTYYFTVVAKNDVGETTMTVTVNVTPKAQTPDTGTDPIVPSDRLMPEHLLQSTKSKSGIQNEKEQAKESAEEVEPVEDLIQKEADSAKEPVKKEEPVKELAKEESITKEPEVKNENPKQEPAK